MQTIDQCRTGPTEPPFDRNASRYAQCRIRKRINKCVSEKRLVKSQRSGVALTERGGSWGPRRFLHLFRAGAGTISDSLAFTFVRLHANTHRLFFRAGAGTISNSLAFTFVCLHGKPYRLFFERELGLYQIRSPSHSFAFMGNRIDYFSSGSSNGLFALLRASSNTFAFMRTHINHFVRAGARTESHKGNICHLIFI